MLEDKKSPFLGYVIFAETAIKRPKWFLNGKENPVTVAKLNQLSESINARLFRQNLDMSNLAILVEVVGLQIEELSSKRFNIISQRFGLHDNGTIKSLGDIAQSEGISIESVRTTQYKALKTVSSRRINKSLKSLLDSLL